ncbi:MAG: MFS transporter [Caldilineaceae bacterium]|nr:MFS transporter [Caldilineaceae bacterium]
MNIAWPRKSIYYGWIIAATLAATQTVSWGVLYYSFSVFLTSFENDLAASRTAITGAFSLALLCSGLIALPVGRWVDQHGARGIMTLGSILATALFFALSAVQSLSMLYLVWAGIGIMMAMTLYEPAFAVVAVWFVRRRTSALALITFVAGLASTIFLPLADWLRQEFGWRSAIMLLALLLGAVTIPLHAFVLRRHPHDLGLVVDGETEAENAGKPQRPAERSRTLHAALRDRAFWWMVIAFVLTTFSTIAISVHLIPYLITRGVTPATAAQVAGLIGIMQVVGRATITPLDGRLAHYLLTALIFALQGLAVLALLLPGFGAVLLFVTLFGASTGAATLARPALIAEHYGSKAYGQISGVVATCLTGARALAPVGAGALYVAFGSYMPVIVGVAALAALAVVATLLVGNPTPQEE